MNPFHKHKIMSEIEIEKNRDPEGLSGSQKKVWNGKRGRRGGGGRRRKGGT